MPSLTIQIDAPPEAVFEELSHVERHPSWANPKAKMTMQQVEGGGPGSTATYRSSGVFTGKNVSADITVTAFEPPRRLAIRSLQHQEARRTSGTSTTSRWSPRAAEPRSRSSSRAT